MERPRIELRLDRLARAAWIASAIVFGLGLLHFYLVFWHGFPIRGGMLRALHLDSEAVIPAWYSSILLFASGLIAWAIGLTDRPDRRTRSFWMMLAILLVYMSADEAASLHEQSANVMGMLGVPEDALGLPTFRWLLVGVPAVLVVALVFLPGLRRIDRRTAARFLVAGGLYVFGAVVMEIAGILPWTASNGESFLAGLSVTVEEGFEFAGLTFLFTTLLGHLARHAPALDLRLHGASAPQAAGQPVRLPGAPAE